MLDYFEKFISIFFVLIFSTIPLYLSVILLGGKTSFMKTLYLMLFSAFISILLVYFFNFGPYLAFFMLIWIYHEFFSLSWIRALMIWFFHIIFLILIILFLNYFGFSFLTEYFVFTNDIILN